RRPVHPRSRGDCGWQPVPAGDRVRADRPNVRDHSGRCPRRGGVHAVAPSRQHHAHPAAGAARRVVVERHRARRDLAGALRHRCRARDRHGHVLAQRRLAARHGLTTVATLITLLTDFGSADSYVGEVKGVLLSQVHGAALVDITHQVPPGDVRAAQYILSRVWHRFPQGAVHLAVVDPGVGTSRRALAAQTAGHFFVAPDNGLLSFLPADAHFVSLPVPPTASPTFHARDLFAPAAGQLALGASLSHLGQPITDPYRSPLPVPREDGGVVVGEVLYVDRFGTLISNIPGDAVEPGVRIKVAGTEIGTLARTFGDVKRGVLAE